MFPNHAQQKDKTVLPNLPVQQHPVQYQPTVRYTVPTQVISEAQTLPTVHHIPTISGAVNLSPVQSQIETDYEPLPDNQTDPDSSIILTKVESEPSLCLKTGKRSFQFIKSNALLKKMKVPLCKRNRLLWSLTIQNRV